ncbi:G2/mitotic-specific cyclin-B1 [Amazona ochrocephala]
MEVWGARFSLGTPSVPSGSPSALRSSRVCSPPASRVCARVPLEHSRGSSPDTLASGWGEADSAACAAFPQSLSLDSPVSGVQPCNPSPCPPSPLEGRGPVPLSARPLLFLQRAQQPGKGNELPVPRRPAVVRHNMTLRPRTALVDIGNRVTEPKAQGATRNLAASGGGGREPGSRPVRSSPRENEVTRRKGRAAPTKRAPPRAPDPKPEPQPQQLESHSRIPMAIPVCAPSDDVMSQACAHDLLHVENVVAEDDNDPEYSHDYAKDIYQYLRELEENLPVRPKYLTGKEISGKMRAILIDRLVQLQINFELQQNTLYMSVAIIDCFLQDNAVSKKMLQLVGVTAVFIASKYEEQCPLCAAQLAYVNTRERVLAKYLMELSIVDYDMVHFPPSKIAAAASCLSLKLLNGCKWTQTLQRHTSYTESDLLPVMQHIAKNVVLVNKSTTKTEAIKKKYASSKNTEISTIEQLNSSVIWNLARSVNKKL